MTFKNKNLLIDAVIFIGGLFLALYVVTLMINQ